MKTDISSKEDIELFVRDFYDKVVADDTIGFIFNDIARVNWDVHIPIMINFWETILLDANSYRDNAMAVHFRINKEVRFEEQYFSRWLELFYTTIDSLFEGPKADLAKKRAGAIASVMKMKMEKENNP
jgi:hemoglobin